MPWREKIKSLLHNLTYVKQERGAIFVLTALLLPVLFGFMGIAYDVGNLYIHKARLQNVTDAAALAGGGLFKNPPEKAEPTEADEYISATSGKVVKLVNSEEVVVKEIQNVDYKDGTTIKDREGGTTVTTNSPNHVKADEVARAYINKNKINLGNDVKTEELSALGYKGTNTTTVNGTPSTTGSVTTTVNTETKKETDAIYYRVIASEEVKLYFLPVIMDKNVQTVRTTSIAVVDNTSETIKTTTITETEGGYNPPSGKTIFDNLFTFSNAINMEGKMENYDFNYVAQEGSVIKSTFDGNIVYTNINANFNELNETDVLQKIFFKPGARTNGTNKRFVELLDEYGWYPEYNSTINIENYKQIFLNKIDHNNPESLGQNDLKTSVWNQKATDYYEYKNQDNGNITIDSAITRGKEADPVFILYRDHNIMKVNFQNNVDTRRPIVIVYLGTNEILFDKCNGTFRGLIYAPYGQVNINYGNFKFYGNIIAKNIYLHGKDLEFHQVNYLKGVEGFTETEIPTITSQIEAITQDKFDETFNSSVKYYSSSEGGGHSNNKGVAFKLFDWLLENGNDVDKYEALPDSGGPDDSYTKKNIIKAWMISYERTLAELAKDGGFQVAALNTINKSAWDTYTSQQGPGTTIPKTKTDIDTNTNILPTKFRLINPRTETNPYFKPNTDIW